MPIIRIFPNSTEDEFASENELATWLMTSLKARNGEYHLTSRKWTKDLTSGSIVFFRTGDKIVGEGVVVRTEPLDDPRLNYEASVWFASGSIRIFAPAIPIAMLQEIIGSQKDITTMANAYARFSDWGIYPKLLAAHIDAGGHFL